MNNMPLLPNREKRAHWRINNFLYTHSEKVLHLAYHAALPILLHAEFLYLIHINFFEDLPETLPYAIEAELLNSPLCNRIDGDLYEIEHEIRKILLQGLVMEYGQERIRDVASLLWHFSNQPQAWLGRDELERSQQLIALHFLDPIKASQWLEVHENQARQRNRSWFASMRREIEWAEKILFIEPKSQASLEHSRAPRLLTADLADRQVLEETDQKEQNRTDFKEIQHQAFDIAKGAMQQQEFRKIQKELARMKEEAERLQHKHNEVVAQLQQKNQELRETQKELARMKEEAERLQHKHNEVVAQLQQKNQELRKGKPSPQPTGTIRTTFSYASILQAIGQVLDQIGVKSMVIYEEEDGLFVEGFNGNNQLQVQLRYDIPGLYDLLCQTGNQVEEADESRTVEIEGTLRRFLTDHNRDLVGAYL